MSEAKESQNEAEARIQVQNMSRAKAPIQDEFHLILDGGSRAGTESFICVAAESACESILWSELTGSVIDSESQVRAEEDSEKMRR